MKMLMANTQSKCIPYAKDRHRLTNTNVALATAGGNAEMLWRRRKQPHSPPSAEQLPGTWGSLRPPRPRAARIGCPGTVMCVRLLFPFPSRTPQHWGRRGHEAKEPGPLSHLQCWGDEHLPSEQHHPAQKGEKPSQEQFPLAQAFAATVNYCPVRRRQCHKFIL